jgi:hypothetical protein
MKSSYRQGRRIADIMEVSRSHQQVTISRRDSVRDPACLFRNLPHMTPAIP